MQSRARRGAECYAGTMRMLGFAPRPELAAVVRRFTIVETDAAATRTLIPDAGVIVGLRYGGFARQLDAGASPLPDATVAGQRDTPRVMHTSAGGGIVLATLHDGRAGAWFRAPLHDLFGATVALDQLAPPADVARALAQVAEARDPAARVRAFEAFLLGQQHEAPDALVDTAVRALRAAHGALRIDQLAGDLDIGRDRLEKRFRRAVGCSPKQLAAILRLRRAIALHRAGAPLTRVAAEAGYFDQPHFIRDFRRFAGAPPSRVLGSDAYC
jgi:AraC-like DNA-binding protein